MSAHTPGPWKAFRASPQSFAVEDADGDTVAEVLESMDGKGAADADLIAAAPDMLEALEMARGIVAAYAPGTQVLEIIDAAIAKARGGIE